jgi:hypothetical protein
MLKQSLRTTMSLNRNWSAASVPYAYNIFTDIFADSSFDLAAGMPNPDTYWYKGENEEPLTDSTKYQIETSLCHDGADFPVRTVHNAMLQCNTV